jgi:hypothetical protein
MESGFYRVFPLLPRVTFAMVLAKCRMARFVTTPLIFSKGHFPIYHPPDADLFFLEKLPPP